MSDDVEVLFENGNGRVVRVADVFVQVRWGVLTVNALDRMVRIFRDARTKTSAKLFAMFVIEPDADVPTAEVRARQKEVLAELGASGPMFGVVVIEGQGLAAHLARSNLAKMSPTTTCVADAREGAEAIVANGARADVAAIVRAVELGRSRSHVV